MTLPLDVFIATRRWDALPAPLWFLVASPLLWWAFGCDGPVFKWPRGCSRAPWRASFWCSPSCGRGL